MIKATIKPSVSHHCEASLRWFPWRKSIYKRIRKSTCYSPHAKCRRHLCTDWRDVLSMGAIFYLATLWITFLWQKCREQSWLDYISRALMFFFLSFSFPLHNPTVPFVHFACLKFRTPMEKASGSTVRKAENDFQVQEGGSPKASRLTEAEAIEEVSRIKKPQKKRSQDSAPRWTSWRSWRRKKKSMKISFQRWWSHGRTDKRKEVGSDEPDWLQDSSKATMRMTWQTPSRQHKSWWCQNSWSTWWWQFMSFSWQWCWTLKMHSWG